jgi:hypothetical protein
MALADVRSFGPVAKVNLAKVDDGKAVVRRRGGRW